MVAENFFSLQIHLSITNHTFRYCKINQNLNSSTCRYSSQVPACLHQRPHRFTTHVMKRLLDARHLGDHPYTVTTGMRPSCTCTDFQRNSYPCKHLLKTWLTSDGEVRIPATTSDPWWNIDTHFVYHEHPNVLPPQNHPVLACEDYDIKPPSDVGDPEELEIAVWLPISPPKPDAKRSSRIKELLKNMTSLAYLLEPGTPN